MAIETQFQPVFPMIANVRPVYTTTTRGVSPQLAHVLDGISSFNLGHVAKLRHIVVLALERCREMAQFR